jgi:hypothetical protein
MVLVHIYSIPVSISVSQVPRYDTELTLEF